MAERTADRAAVATWDRAVAVRLIAGDASALSEVYDQLSGYVFGLARKVIRDPDRAEDVTQEVFCQLWERPDRFDPERGTLRSFLGVVTHRRAVDHVRRAEASRKREQGQADVATIPPDITEAVHAGLEADRVRAAVEALPDDQRTPVLLAYFGGRTFKEVADILHIPEGTAKSRIRAALDKLARALETKVAAT